jgi:hypothetical protein
MDNANVQKYMPTSGGGSDRALITDHSSHFMRTGDSAGMFAQALVADGIPINYVDEKTGKPVDTIKDPLTNTYSPSVRPWFALGLKNADGVNYSYSGGWNPSIDHFPSLTYVAFQASRDIGLLYNLQHAGNLPSIQHPYASANYTGNPPKAIVSPEQTREIAWGLRLIFEAHTATKDAEALGILPADLHPSSYFKGLLDNNLAYYGPMMNDPDRQTFRLIGPTPRVAHWQCDYLLSVLEFAVLTGHSDWTQLFLWALGNIVARTNGTSGWPLALCAVYYMNTVLGGYSAAPGAKQFTWSEAFDNQLVPADAINVLSKEEYDAIVANPQKLFPKYDGTSLMGARFVLTAADYLDKKGLAKVRATYKDFDSCLENMELVAQQHAVIQLRGANVIAERYSIVTNTENTPLPAPPQPEPSPAPAPQPSPAQPPTGGTMAKFIQGTAYILTPQWDGAIYSVPVWNLDKPDQLKLEVAQDGKSAKLTPNVDNTAEDFTVTVKAQNDPDKPDSFAVITMPGSDVLRGATSVGSKMVVAVAPAGATG